MKTDLIKLDERGRATLGKEVTEVYGDRFIIIKAPKEIVLKPLTKDPIKLLQKEGEKLPKGISIKQLRRIAYNRAMSGALTNIERLEISRFPKLRKKKR